MRDRPVISIENYTINCGDADESKLGGCAIAVRNDYKNLVEEFGSTSSRCAFLRLRDRGGRELWIVSARASTETYVKSGGFEKAWEDKNPRKAYFLLKQYSCKMKGCSPVLNTANEVAVGEATIPF
ncbi:hypothetical protein RB195_025120 [Necator americanus]|uniref:Uncharacterized protein n=1 Tax=Necator americanus TaxID=51031 RepID=A0ABR1EQY6_NECAM